VAFLHFTNNRLGAFIYPLGLMILIFIESSIPMEGGEKDIAFLTELNPIVQNLLHIPLYGLLAFFWGYALRNFGFKIVKALFLAFFITIFYGCIDEFHQAFVPGRFGGLLDILLDGIGGGIGISVYSLGLRQK